MNFLRDIVLFFLANALGFFGAALAYHFAILIGIAPSAEALAGVPQLNEYFLSATMIVWMICAALSIGFFFIKDKARYIALLLPALAPFFYGLSVLVRLLASGPVAAAG
jgi:hypothetical protein